MSLLRQLLGLVHHDPQQAAHGQAVQNPGFAPVQGSQGVPAIQGQDMGGQLGGGNIVVPGRSPSSLRDLIGGSPQGFPGEGAMAQMPQANMQQSNPVTFQSAAPLQTSGVNDIALQGSNRRRTPTITF